MSFSDFEPTYIRPRNVGDVAVIAFTVPRLTDDENIEQIGRELFAVIEHYGRRKVVVSLAEVSYLTSSVLGKLITLHRRLHRAGGRMVLCGFRDEVADVLETSRLDEYFETAPDVEAAVARLQSSPL
ncbi:MAG: STAS domain-containing protein [Planctomycetales bacterium]